MKDHKSSKKLYDKVVSDYNALNTIYWDSDQRGMRTMAILYSFVKGRSLKTVEHGDFSQGDFKASMRLALVFVGLNGLSFDIRNFVEWVNETTQEKYKLTLESARDIIATAKIITNYKMVE